MITTNNTHGILFEALGNRQFRFRGKMHDPKTLMVWEIMESAHLHNKERLVGIDIKHIDVPTLKSIGVWDNLSPAVQKEMEQIIHVKKQEVNQLMEKARAGRKKKYIDMPKELVCIKCGAKKEIAPGLLIARAEKIAKEKQIIFTFEDYLKQYQCQSCKPTKGRKSNPELAHLPKELVCKCGEVLPCSPSYIVMRAKSKGVTPEDFVKNFVCQKCCPSHRGRPKKIKE